MKPIVGPDGKTPLYAVERRIIGTEYPNAVAKWTRRHSQEANREHDIEGVHTAPFHCQGVIRVRLDPLWAKIEPWSKYRTREVQRNPTAIELSVAGDGEGTLIFAEDLPSNPLVIVRAVPVADNIYYALEVSVSVGTNDIYIRAETSSGPYSIYPIDVFIYG